jgi:hypothetical protein
MSIPQTTASPSQNPLLAAVKKLSRQTSFVVAVAVLLVAALSLNAATNYLKLFFKKLPMNLQHRLDAVPLTLDDKVTGAPHWRCVSKDEALPVDIADELGTEQFVFRDYLNVETPEMRAEAEQLLRKSGKDLKIGVEELRRSHPDAVINFAVTYYTGKADTVPHIPDRCYVADGYEPKFYKTEHWGSVRTPLAPQGVDVRFISFEDQTGNGKVTRNVAYFFNCNGSYTSNPTDVRLKLQNLFEKYGYFAKVEVMMQLPDGARAAEKIKLFLADVLPDVEKALPDWNHRPR